MNTSTDFEEADVLLIEDPTITAAQGKRRDWYMDALDRIRRGATVKHPHGPREDDFPPSSLRVRQKIILLAESQYRYDPVWKKIPGIAFDESAVDLYNYMQRARASVLETHGVSEDARSRVAAHVRGLCRFQPEYFAKPKRNPLVNLAQLIDALKRFDADEGTWNDVFRSWRERADKEMQAKNAHACYELGAFHTLDGVRGMLMLPRMVEAFMNGDRPLFSFVLRHPIHLQGWHIAALEKYAGSENIVRMKPGGPTRAIPLYDALVKAQDGGVVIADFLIETSAQSKEGKEVITMISQVAAGKTVTRPRGADEALPESIDFTGKLFLLDEGIPKSGKMRQLVESNPGVQIQDSFSDTVHRLAWWDSDDIEDADLRDDSQQMQPAEWKQLLAALFRFTDRFPDQTLARLNTGPSEGMLFKSRKKILASDGDLRDAEDFELETYVQELWSEKGRPDQTIEPFENRIGS
jgi:hypothetical protein